jgi:hypothetical protein
VGCTGEQKLSIPADAFETMDWFGLRMSVTRLAAARSTPGGISYIGNAERSAGWAEQSAKRKPHRLWSSGHAYFHLSA